MIGRLSGACLMTLAALLLTPGPQSVYAKAHSIEIVAQILEPAQMYHQGKPVGFAADLMKEIRKRVLSRTHWNISNIHLGPWHLAYHKLKSNPNTLMFSISRTQKREKQFIWAGKILSYDIQFYSIGHGHAKQAGSLHQLVKMGYRFGVPEDGVLQDYAQHERFVLHQGFETYAHYSRGVKLLFSRQLTAIPLLAHNAKALVCREGYDGERIHSLFGVQKLTKPLWMVFSKGTSPEVVAEFQRALVEVQQEKLDVSLQSRYVTEFQMAACQQMRMTTATP